MDGAADPLAWHNDAYTEWLEVLDALDWRRDAEAVLRYSEAAAGFATFHHAGRFADGALENRLLRIGQNLDDLIPRAARPAYEAVRSRRDRRRRVLHVATALHPVGGVTRGLFNWIRNDSTSRHSVLVTRQRDHAIRDWMRDVISANGGRLHVLPPEAPLLMKAWWARQIAQSDVDLLVLHHACDVVPVAAFGVPACPPAALVNHADHAFWLGGSVTDVLVNLRDLGSAVGKGRRPVRRNRVLPIPMTDWPDAPTRREARLKLAIPDNQLMMISIARPQKFVPDGSRNFFATAARILDRNPRAHVYVVGVTADYASSLVSAGLHRRLHCEGTVEHPGLYQRAADLYLESFPAGSRTAVLEACLAGLPVVMACDLPARILGACDDAIARLVRSPADEQEYIDRAILLGESSLDRARELDDLRASVLQAHTGPGWLQQVQELYAAMQTVQHRPAAILVAECAQDELDRGLARWHAATSPLAVSRPGDVQRAAAFDIAYDLRQLGRYRAAFRLLRASDSRWMCHFERLKPVLKLAPHWVLTRPRVAHLERLILARVSTAASAPPAVGS